MWPGAGALTTYIQYPWRGRPVFACVSCNESSSVGPTQDVTSSQPCVSPTHHSPNHSALHSALAVGWAEGEGGGGVFHFHGSQGRGSNESDGWLEDLWRRSRGEKRGVKLLGERRGVTVHSFLRSRSEEEYSCPAGRGEGILSTLVRGEPSLYTPW